MQIGWVSSQYRVPLGHDTIYYSVSSIRAESLYLDLFKFIIELFGKHFYTLQPSLPLLSAVIVHLDQWFWRLRICAVNRYTRTSPSIISSLRSTVSRGTIPIYICAEKLGLLKCPGYSALSKVGPIATNLFQEFTPSLRRTRRFSRHMRSYELILRKQICILLWRLDCRMYSREKFMSRRHQILEA